MSHQPLTFKQYLELSKQQLLTAIHNSPVVVTEHEVHKYCTIQLGESQDDSCIVQLKPKQKIVVEWDYSVTPPIPSTITIYGSSVVDEDDKMDVYWSHDKLSKWLTRNTTEKTDHGYKV